MARDVPSVVGPAGWVSWSELTSRVDRSTVSVWMDGGKLIRLEKGVYADGSVASDWRVRVEAAVRTRNGVASHATALSLWGVLPPGVVPAS